MVTGVGRAGGAVFGADLALISIATVQVPIETLRALNMLGEPGGSAPGAGSIRRGGVLWKGRVVQWAADGAATVFRWRLEFLEVAGEWGPVRGILFLRRLVFCAPFSGGNKF